MTMLPARVLFGAAYYPEYQPYERLKTDLDLMVAAKFTVIRVGESVWSTWEPENGRFDLDWLQPVLDGAHERGISVILGSPTYAVPPWLARQYPEIAAEHATARRTGWWVDGLTVIDAEVLAEYDHPHFGRWPAVTTRRHGAGRVTYVGTVPGRGLARALATWLTPAPSSGWHNLPESVTATTGTSPEGHRVHVVHNWSWQPADVQAPAHLTDVLDGSSVPAATALSLTAWDVRIFVTGSAPGR